MRKPMSRDYYAEGEQIACSLESHGLTSEAKCIRDAIDGGSTASEILMRLRWQLLKIDAANLPMNLGTRAKIRDLSLAIGAALGQ